MAAGTNLPFIGQAGSLTHLADATGGLSAAGGFVLNTAATDTIVVTNAIGAATRLNFCPCLTALANNCPVCGCDDIGIPSAAPTSAPTTAPTVATNAPTDSWSIDLNDDSLSAGDIAGIVIGAVGGSFLFLLIGVLVGGMVGGKASAAAAPAGQL